MGIRRAIQAENRVNQMTFDPKDVKNFTDDMCKYWFTNEQWGDADIEREAKWDTICYGTMYPTSKEATMLDINGPFKVLRLKQYPCQQIDIASEIGDDGGMVWYSKSEDLIYYSGDHAVAAFRYFNNIPKYRFSGRREWGAIHADPVSGQIYQLYTDDDMVLEPIGTFAKVACLQGDLSIEKMMTLEKDQKIQIKGYYAYIGHGKLAIWDAEKSWHVIGLSCEGFSLPVVTLQEKWPPKNEHNICEHQYQGGILEEYKNQYWIIYPHNKFVVKRQIAGGNSLQIIGNSGSVETCSLALDLRRRRWFYHKEEIEQLNGPEPLFSCPALIESQPDPQQLTTAK